MTVEEIMALFPEPEPIGPKRKRELSAKIRMAADALKDVELELNSAQHPATSKVLTAVLNARRAARTLDMEVGESDER
jgi:hypothetical protein